MIRVNNQYLDLGTDTDIFVERQSKLFEELDSTQKDFSASFEFPASAKNLSILGFPLPDVSSKTIYNDIECEIIGTDGIPLYKGRLRVERVTRRIITASFYSGNYNWLSLISGDLSDIDFSQYDTDQTYAAISASWNDEEGLIFPLIDNGALVTRSYKDMFVEDFQGALYVKTIFKKIFYSVGIKFQGELVNDWVFNKLIVCRNNKDREQINSRSSYVNKTGDQTYEATTTAKITFTDDSTFPFFDGSEDNYSTVNSRYTADVEMDLTIDLSLILTRSGSAIANFYIYKNGAELEIIHPQGSKTVHLEAGDYVEIYLDFTVPVEAGITIENNSTVKYTPQYVFKAFGNAIVPKWTKKDFVLSVLNLFNVIADFDPVGKVVTFNLFEKLKTKTPVDISAYVDPDTIETDFIEFIQNFGRKSYLTYTESDDEDLKEYNISEFVKYGAGFISVDNDFIEEERTIIDSAFKAPISYKNSVLDASLERTNFVTLDEADTTGVTGVTDSSGIAQFAVDDDIFAVNDLVRITDSTNEAYNGDWRVDEVGAGYVKLNGVNFDTNATADIALMRFTYSNSDDTFLFINMPEYDVDNYSSIESFELEGNSVSTPAFAYFNLLNTDKPANDILLQAMTFGEVNDPLSYQKTLTETYWRSVSTILNDPVKLIANFYFPQAVFRSLSPLTPVYLKTEHTTNLYYINRIRGYISSHLPCEVELIKL